ncbi:MAG: L-histidine Nalpha-methyltransferase [Solirubrobacteraceae bacterium]|nr:L-histidine Nalpha-methyltransferase [Solirubrobacteraceae bacterium]
MTSSAALESLVEDVRAGLTGEGLKELSPKYLYDARGSDLFEQITAQPEYYPTRCERAILNRHAPAIVGGASELVELGSGVASKTRALLYAMAGDGALSRYVPFDVDPWVVERCEDELTELYPGLEVHGVVGDFLAHLADVPGGGPRIVALLGGTIGNLKPADRAPFLRSIRELLGPDDRFLLGTDLVKDTAVLEAAYNDAAGVSAAFNRNVLNVLNRELGADFELDAFAHVAFFDRDASWIDIRLRSRRDQRVSIPGAGIEVDLREGEDIRTEVSAKFTLEALARELREAGMELERFFTDPEGLFGLSLSAPR